MIQYDLWRSINQFPCSIKLLDNLNSVSNVKSIEKMLYKKRNAFDVNVLNIDAVGVVHIDYLKTSTALICDVFCMCVYICVYVYTCKMRIIAKQERRNGESQTIVLIIM